VADYLEFAQLLVKDALERKESCGGHFREEYKTPEGEAKRDDANFSHVSVWEYQGDNKEPIMNKEKLEFEYLKPMTRSYK
jgi:succinate dehydrogenase / fumarate reductase flavoprotein subunit